MHGNKLHSGAFSANSAIIFYLKLPLKVLNVTFHLVLELRKCSNFHHLFNSVSLMCGAPWIITTTHFVYLRTPRAMGSLQTEAVSKVLTWRPIDCVCFVLFVGFSSLCNFLLKRNGDFGQQGYLLNC